MFSINSFLFIPFNKTNYFYNESAKLADSIIVDFEDSVECKLDESNISEIKVAFDNLRKNNFIVRIGVADYFDIVKILGLDSFDGVMIPKCVNTKEVTNLIDEITKQGKDVYLLIESAKGLLDLQSILSKYKIQGVFFGSEDYISNINAQRTEKNLQYARSSILNISKAFNVRCYDTIYPFLKDIDGLNKETQLAFEMGFDGKMAIHPLQLSVINEAFKVTMEKITEYKMLIDKYIEYTQYKDTKVMVLDGVVIEPPHIKKMKLIVDEFERGGSIE